MYLAGSAARRNFSNQLTAASFDIDLNGIDVFRQAASFEQADTAEVRLKKLQDLRQFTIALSHKILRLTSANWVHFESIAPLSDCITACAEKLTSFGLLEGSKYNLDVLHNEVQSLVAQARNVQYDECYQR